MFDVSDEHEPGSTIHEIYTNLMELVLPIW